MLKSADHTPHANATQYTITHYKYITSHKSNYIISLLRVNCSLTYYCTLDFFRAMEFSSNGEGYSIPNAIPMNTSPLPHTSPSSFGFHYAENSQFADSFPQLRQKAKNPADIERINPEEKECVVNGAGTVKASKKRSRTSSRTPTTLLNTDTANFKAMVQRFTGIPEIPFRFSSMNPSFSAHVDQQELQLIGKPLACRVLLDPNINCASHLNSVRQSYHPQEYNSSKSLPFQSLHDYLNTSSPPFQSLHDYLNTSSPLNFFPEAPQCKPSSTSPVDDMGLIDSAILFPSDRRSNYLI